MTETYPLPFGATTTDPEVAIKALNADPQFVAAFNDANHPAHSIALDRRRQLFEAAYGTDLADQGIADDDVTAAATTGDEFTAFATAIDLPQEIRRDVAEAVRQPIRPGEKASGLAVELAQRTVKHFRLNERALEYEIKGEMFGNNPHVINALARYAFEQGL
jgi:hypothetical protein